MTVRDVQVADGQEETVPEIYASHVGVGTEIWPGAYIAAGTIIGRDCIIGANAVIGGPGFGYTEDEYGTGTWVPKSHDFKVVIGNNVEIGANTCIDRGSWRDTIIGSGTKIDNLVHIAHNVWVGENCLIIAQAMIGGSVTLEDGAWVGPGVNINQRLTIGRRAFLGTGSVVTRNVEPEMVMAGVPAKVMRRREATDL